MFVVERDGMPAQNEQALPSPTGIQYQAREAREVAAMENRELDLAG
jgi:hypothetical protein